MTATCTTAPQSSWCALSRAWPCLGWWVHFTTLSHKLNRPPGASLSSVEISVGDLTLGFMFLSLLHGFEGFLVNWDNCVIALW